MSIFDVIRVATPITGALLGCQGHESLHVGAAGGLLIGAAAGVIASYAMLFALAAVLSLLTGKPLFPPKNEKTDGA